MNTELLFSYGTLQTESVQLATFERVLEGTPDALSGYSQSMLAIDDPAVVATSGATHHPIVKFSGVSTDRVEGTVFRISAEELERADRYEVAAYKRIAVMLVSGLGAWVYVNAIYAPPSE
jgi:gamma-glutamylcyclotransferase (GGCT)/AIG2-like uncharacterized protein YtfP